MPSPTPSPIPHQPELSLLVDRSFRATLALAHAVASLGIELHFADATSCWVSHESAFRPVMPPCLLRVAMAEAAAGEPPGWLSGVTGWSAGGPFVEPLGQGVVAHVVDGRRVASFATPLTPMVVDRLARATVAGDDLGRRLSADAAVGATVAHLSRAGGEPDDDALTLAGACRGRSAALRAAAG